MRSFPRLIMVLVMLALTGCNDGFGIQDGAMPSALSTVQQGTGRNSSDVEAGVQQTATPTLGPTQQAFEKVYNFYDHAVERTESWVQVTEDTLGVHVTVPGHWTRDPAYGHRWSGPDGFVEFGVLSGVSSAREGCEQLANATAKRYGAEPFILSEDAVDPPCMVMPSLDQLSPHHEHAAVFYAPTPLTVDGESYDFLVSYVSGPHVLPILSTLEFLNAGGDVVPTPVVEPSARERFTSDEFLVTVSVPAGFQADEGIGGSDVVQWDDGYLMLVGLTGPESTWAACEEQANHPLRPFGESPIIEDVKIPAGQPVCIVRSGSGNPDERQLAIVAYPEPLLLRGVALEYVMLDAYGADIRPILESLRFESPSPVPTPSAVMTEEWGVPATTPTPTPMPNPLWGPTDAPAVINYFEVTPTRPEHGDNITVTWDAQGREALLCQHAKSLSAVPQSSCEPVPLAGSQTLDIVDHGLFYLTVELQVYGHGPTDLAYGYIVYPCEYEWMMEHPPSTCPIAPAVQVDAAAQPYENGWLVRLAETLSPFPIVLAFIDTDETATAGRYVQLGPADPLEPDPANGAPPEGLLLPDPLFYQNWLVPGVGAGGRDGGLGWATAGVMPYTARWQCENALPLQESGICFASLPDGRLLAYSERSFSYPWSWYEWGQPPRN